MLVTTEKFEILDEKLSAFRAALAEALEKMGEAARRQAARLAELKAARLGRLRKGRAACHEGLSDADIARNKTYRGLERTLGGLSKKLGLAVSDSVAWI